MYIQLQNAEINIHHIYFVMTTHATVNIHAGYMYAQNFNNLTKANRHNFAQHLENEFDQTHANNRFQQKSDTVHYA